MEGLKDGTDYSGKSMKGSGEKAVSDWNNLGKNGHAWTFSGNENKENSINSWDI